MNHFIKLVIWSIDFKSFLDRLKYLILSHIGVDLSIDFKSL